MSFQFQCPQGHLLEGDPSQAGQQCQCPMCGMLFIIPQPIGAAEAAPPAPAPETPPEPELLHIPCPQGHELEVPLDMLEQEVLCPHCKTQFLLRKRDSVEYRRKAAIEMEKREERQGEVWLKWSIAIAVIVVVGLIVMVVAGGQKKKPAVGLRGGSNVAPCSAGSRSQVACRNCIVIPTRSVSEGLARTSLTQSLAYAF